MEPITGAIVAMIYLFCKGGSGIRQIQEWIDGSKKTPEQIPTKPKPLVSESIKRIAVLGMPGVGKTTLHRFMQGLPEVKEVIQTPADGVPYNQYEYKKQDGTIITIASGIDIAGIEEAQYEYPPLIQKSDVVFFLFNLRKYADEKKYEEDVHARLDLIAAYLGKKNLGILMTFIEEFATDKEREQAILGFKEKIRSKSFSDILKFPMEAVSLKCGFNKTKIKYFIDKLI